jgi:hypothetical protein
VLDGLDMKPVPTMVGLELARDRIEANTGDVAPAEAFSRRLGTLRRAFAELAAALRAPSGRSQCARSGPSAGTGV